ncbi:MAG: ChuX/HutX family heme-like substrate-binding protein [Steroidobacteraceae bacterium]
MHGTLAGTLLALTGLALASPAVADSFCATPEQAKQVADFYAAHPATMPPVAAARLKLPEATVASALGADSAASAPGADFAEIWAKLGEMSQLTFLIMKGPNVFEIASAAGKGTPSKTSQYFNIAYTQPLRGHLRPDLYASVYAVTLGAKDENQVAPRGVLVYDASGASVFGAFLGGDGPKPTAADLAKFSELMTLVRAKTPVCPRR